MLVRNAVLELFNPEVASEVDAAASFATAIDMLDNKNPATLAALSAVNTLASQALRGDAPLAKPILQKFGAGLGIAALAESIADGDLNMDDVAAAAAAFTGISRAKVSAACSNSKVKALPLRAHGTSTCFTPCSGHFTRGIEACT